MKHRGFICTFGSDQWSFENQAIIVIFFTEIFSYIDCTVDCPLSEGNQAAHPKFERPNGKNTKSKSFFESVKNWCGQLTCTVEITTF